MSVDLHPQRRELDLFVDGRLAAPDNRRVVRHLLAGCEVCRKIAADIWRPAPSGDTGLAVDRAIRIASEHRTGIEAERAAAGRLMS